MGEIKYDEIALMNMSLLKADNENLRANAELLQEENKNLHATVKALEADKAKYADEILRLRRAMKDIDAIVTAAIDKYMRKIEKEEMHCILYGTGEKVKYGVIGAKDAFKEKKS